MLSNLTTNQLILTAIVGIVYIIGVFFLVRAILRNEKSPYEVVPYYSQGQDVQYDYQVTTQPCKVCGQVDQLNLTLDDVRENCAMSGIGLGEHYITHDDHTNIVYVDNSGSFAGQDIPLSDLRRLLDKKLMEGTIAEMRENMTEA